MKRKLVVLVVLALGLAMTFAQGAKDQTEKVYRLKMAYTPTAMDPSESPDVMFGDVFKKYVEAESSGKIIIDIYPGGQLGSAAETVQGVSSGAIELAVINISMLNNIYKPTMLLSIPGLFSSIEECNAILNGEWGKGLFEDVKKVSGIRIMNTGSNGFRHFTNNIREVRTMEDTKGITFRVMENPVSVKMVESMGARAVPMPGSEMYMAMKTKVVDGQENPILNIIQDKTYEVQKYLTLDGHMASIMAYIINDTVYSSMPENLKKIVLEGSRLATEAANDVIEKRNADGLDFLKTQGMIITQPQSEDLNKWHSTIFSATQSFVRNEIGNEVVDSLIKAIEQYRK
jgi:C4-dicarboxylate-binding protein DctP